MSKLCFSVVRGGIRQRTAAGLALLALSVWVANVQAAPVRPDNDAQVLERLPISSFAAARDLQRLQKELTEDPRNLPLAVDLAGRYIGLGRGEADPRYYSYAEAALQPWWHLEEPPLQVLVLRAVVYQNRHDFDAALRDLDRVLGQRPDHAQALLTRSFVLQVKGRNADALQSCRRLPANVDPLVGAICAGRIASLTGAAAKGYESLRRVTEAAPGADARLRLWALTNLAEIAVRLGKVDEAERHFRAALGLAQRDAYLLGAYADFLLDQSRTEEARALLQDETRVDALLLRLIIAETRLGRESAQSHRQDMIARFDASRRRGSLIHRREEARFALDVLARPGEALDLAEVNWAVQKEPADALLLLRAALAAGEPARAQPVIGWLRGARLEDVAITALIQRLEAGQS